MSELAGMREAYRDSLYALAQADPRVICVDTDTGLFDPAGFGPAGDRYLNVGIAEQNAVGAAAGLAASGFLPYVTTMAAFVGRAFEALKLDVAYGGLPVRLVATHAGLSAGHLGPTHHGLEDLALTRSLPGLTVVVPADAAAVRRTMSESVALPGPLYLRLGRAPTPLLPAGHPPPPIGRTQRLRAGRDIVLLCCGAYPVLESLAAAERLAVTGIDAGVLNVATVKPLDRAAVLAEVVAARLVVCVDEHWPAGGLGSAVAEMLAAAGGPPLLAIGVPDGFRSVAGEHGDLLDLAGLRAGAIAERVYDHLAAGIPALPRGPVKEKSFNGHDLSRV